MPPLAGEHPDREVLQDDRRARTDLAPLAGERRKDARPSRGPWPQPARDAARPLATKHALAHPAWGHRKVWAMVRHEGHQVSQATVLPALRDDGLILPAEYQRELGRLAEQRRAAFAATPTGPNQVWQLDFSEFETTQGGT